MSPENPDPPPIPPLPAQPIVLNYATPTYGRRPSVITTMGVIGICLAALGLLAAAYGGLSSVAYSVMASSRGMTVGAVAARISEAAVGAILAGLLLAGSIGLLRLCPWSRRVLHWWAALYLLANFVFLSLQLLVIVPSEIGMMTNIMTALPAAAATTMPTTGPAPTTAPAGDAAPPESIINAQYSTYSTASVTISLPGGGKTTTMTTATATPVPPAQALSMLRLIYSGWVIAKAALCLIYPVALLIVLRLKRVRAALAPQDVRTGT
jgi:hypothetical protein